MRQMHLCAELTGTKKKKADASQDNFPTFPVGEFWDPQTCSWYITHRLKEELVL